MRISRLSQRSLGGLVLTGTFLAGVAAGACLASSSAVMGASVRSGIATTVRDNIARVGGSARCYFVNPRYDEVDGTPCHPDLASLPEIPDSVVLAVNPLRAAELTRQAAAAGIARTYGGAEWLLQTYQSKGLPDDLSADVAEGFE